jgi:hypothetical protein
MKKNKLHCIGFHSRSRYVNLIRSLYLFKKIEKKKKNDVHLSPTMNIALSMSAKKNPKKEREEIQV